MSWDLVFGQSEAARSRGRSQWGAASGRAGIRCPANQQRRWVGRGGARRLPGQSAAGPSPRPIRSELGGIRPPPGQQRLWVEMGSGQDPIGSDVGLEGRIRFPSSGESGRAGAGSGLQPIRGHPEKGRANQEPGRAGAGSRLQPIRSHSGRAWANQEWPGRVGGGIKHRANQERRRAGEGSSEEPIRSGRGLGRDAGQSQSGASLAGGRDLLWSQSGGS